MATVSFETPGDVNHANRRPRRGLMVGFFCLLFCVDYFLYFRHAGHFFQGDSIFLLYHRVTSISGFLGDFVRLHASGWYRPLANELIESIFYPVFGLSPVPYRIPVYALFMAVSVMVYALALALTRNRLAAALAAFYFSIHTTNAYTTFDIGFVPELLYTFFYLGSALAYLRYLSNGTTKALGASLACFAGSLLSKEMAVTLPGTLIVLHLLMGQASRPFGSRVLQSIRSTSAHTLMLVAYLIFVLGYLGVGGVAATASFEKPADVASGGYYVVLDDTVAANADFAASWAFNLPRGWWGGWQAPTPGEITFLKVFRAIVLALVVILLTRPKERKGILSGLAWFCLTIIPALPLLNHFIPYYLFLPVAGVSLVVGISLAWGYETLGRFQPLLAALFIIILLGGVLYVSSGSIQADIRENQLLGGSALAAGSSLADLRSLYPTLPAGAVLYIDDIQQPLAWNQSSGALVRMSYGAEDISVLYRSQGDVLSAERFGDRSLLVFKFENNHLIDNTEAFRIHPNDFIQYEQSDRYTLTVSATEVIAGQGGYSLSISGTHDVTVHIAYALDGGLPEVFTAQLDGRGQVRFEVSPDTRKGLYHFMGFNISGQTEWFRAEATLRVQ